jgi:hypothetical protein
MFTIRDADVPRSTPSAAQMASSATQSMIAWAMGGFRTVTPEQLAERMAVCRGCEYWNEQGFGGTGRCMRCGCSTQAKLRMATEKCPVGKW